MVLRENFLESFELTVVGISKLYVSMFSDRDIAAS